MYRQSVTMVSPPGSKHGALVSSVGAAWADLTPADFNELDASTLGATDRFAQLVVKNTHATQTLYILLRANAAEATSVAHALAAGDAFTYDISACSNGVGTSTISLQGSGAATTYSAFCAAFGAP